MLLKTIDQYRVKGISNNKVNTRIITSKRYFSLEYLER